METNTPQKTAERTTKLMAGGRRLAPLNILYFSQFLSAFADNMILFVTLAIIKANALPEFYIGVVQAAFLLSFVICAPFVGAFADRNYKSRVLLIGNGVKAIGMVLLMLGVDPALSYAVVGIGAAIYSPAKYGILPELTSGGQELLRANARMEGFTILAILTGSLCGGIVAESSLRLGMVLCVMLYVIALVVSLKIPYGSRNPAIRYGRELVIFFQDTTKLFRSRKTRFSLVGTGSFWMSSAVLRLALIAWVPVHLGLQSLDSISMLTAVTGIGIMAGSLATPKLVPAARYYNAWRFGGAMVVTMLLFPFLHLTAVTVGLLLVIGFAGGVFIVPMNTALQEEGQLSVGAGKTIAVQNLIENALMLLGVGIYTKITAWGASADASILGMAAVLAVMVLYLVMEARKLARA
ncbi:lysophospholipid transporter LplT [Paenibacillus cremeus]|nr:lysophospholipid transporter LplT [Paenibacillus cremeus]